MTPAMNLFDKTILQFLNGYVGRWPRLELFLAAFEDNHFLKGALLVSAFWYLWFRAAPGPAETTQVRQKLAATICAVVVAIIVGRLLALLLPFRVRPLFNPELHMRIPAGFASVGLVSWSAFPSDHALLWFTMAFGLLQIQRSLGLLACAYGCFLSFCRVIGGVHHPTDIVGGMAIAAIILWLAFRVPVRTVLYRPVAWAEQRHPGLFYALAFLLTFEVSSMFDEVRALMPKNLL